MPAVPGAEAPREERTACKPAAPDGIADFDRRRADGRPAHPAGRQDRSWKDQCHTRTARPSRAPDNSSLHDVSKQAAFSFEEDTANFISTTSILRLALPCAEGSWWSQTGSNRRPPACKAGALPTELWPLEKANVRRTNGRYPTRRQRRPLKARPHKWWAWIDSNDRPHPYQGCALTT
jgi:hypothetical protein